MSGYLTVATDSNNDLYQDGGGNLAMFTDVNALALVCQQALQAQLREMVLNYNAGMPTMDAVFNEVNLQYYNSVGIKTLMGLTGVVSVLSFVSAISNGQMTYTADILTIYSPSIVNINTGV